MESSKKENITRLFFDTNFYVALANPKDSLHQESKDLLQYLLTFDHYDITSNFILLEAVTIISQRVSRQAAIEFKEEELNQVDLIRINKDLEQRSWEIFKQVDNKNISYVDCSILAVIENLEIDLLASFYHHFHHFQKEFSFQLLEAGE